MIGDNHFKCGGDDTTAEHLCLKLRNSHGLISVQNIIPALLQTYSTGTDSINGYLWESKYC